LPRNIVVDDLIVDTDLKLIWCHFLNIDFTAACFQTRQTSTFALHRKYLGVLIKVTVVFLISSQTEI
jgi:hypothetical protein